jgi:hypothetical protein
VSAPACTAVLAIGGVWSAGAAVLGRGTGAFSVFREYEFPGGETGRNTIGLIQKYNLKGTEIPASLEYQGRVADSLNLSDPCYISD